MQKDPIVEEVRSIRETIAKECNYDFTRMIQRGWRIQKQWKGNVVTKEELDRDRTDMKQNA